jgi:hypothetical protein
LFLFFRIDSTETCSADKISHMHGLLYSQIGYDLGLPMRALIRASARGHVSDNTPFALIDGHDATVLSGTVRYWGQIWGEHWWICDFSALNAPGDYTLRIGPPEDPLYPDAMISVGAHLLFERTVALVGIGQFEERQRRARNDSGWKDCGHFWREANSHASTLIGMCDLLAYGFEWLSPSERARLVRQIVTGCDYLAQLQDYAAMVGHPDGAIAHELPNFPMLIPGDQAQSAVALIRSARLVFEMHPDKAADYLRRGERAYLYLTRAMRPIGQTGFSASNHGAPSGYQVPDEFTTRDLMMTLWAAEELWISGKWAYKDEAVALAARIIDRQVPESAAEDGLHGHFYAFSDRAFSEKANTHHHIGHDTGGTFPHYLVALIDMCKRWDDHPDAPRWRLAVERARLSDPGVHAQSVLAIANGRVARPGAADVLRPMAWRKRQHRLCGHAGRAVVDVSRRRRAARHRDRQSAMDRRAQQRADARIVWRLRDLAHAGGLPGRRRAAALADRRRRPALSRRVDRHHRHDPKRLLHQSAVPTCRRADRRQRQPASVDRRGLDPALRRLDQRARDVARCALLQRIGRGRARSAPTADGSPRTAVIAHCLSSISNGARDVTPTQPNGRRPSAVGRRRAQRAPPRLIVVVQKPPGSPGVDGDAERDQQPHGPAADA